MLDKNHVLTVRLIQIGLDKDLHLSVLCFVMFFSFWGNQWYSYIFLRFFICKLKGLKTSQMESI